MFWADRMILWRGDDDPGERESQHFLVHGDRISTAGRDWVTGGREAEREGPGVDCLGPNLGSTTGQ